MKVVISVNKYVGMDNQCIKFYKYFVFYLKCGKNETA